MSWVSTANHNLGDEKNCLLNLGGWSINNLRFFYSPNLWFAENEWLGGDTKVSPFSSLYQNNPHILVGFLHVWRKNIHCKPLILEFSFSSIMSYNVLYDNFLANQKTQKWKQKVNPFCFLWFCTVSFWKIDFDKKWCFLICKFLTLTSFCKAVLGQF